MVQFFGKPDRTMIDRPLIKNDILFRRIERWSAFTVWLSAIVIYCTVDIAVGLMTSYLHPGENYVSIGEIGEIANSINVWVVFLPMIWMLYRWLPETAYVNALTLESQKLIRGPENQPDQNEKNPEEKAQLLSDQIRAAISRPWIYRLALVGMLLSTLIFNLYGIPMSTLSVGRVNFWFYTPLAWVIFNFLYVPSNYVLFLMAFRQVSVSRTIAEFFQQPGCITKVYPLHPDRCGGFSGIGRLTTRTSLAVIVVLVWMLIYSYYPVLLGGNPDWTVIWLVYIVYVVVVPLVLIGPLWRPHQAMMEYKSNMLKQISEEIFEGYNQSLENVRTDGKLKVPSNLERINKMVALYESLDKNIPVWPIAFRSVRNISLTALSPLVLSLLPVIFDFVKLIEGRP